MHWAEDFSSVSSSDSIIPSASELVHDNTFLIDITVSQYHTALYVTSIAFSDNLLWLFKRLDYS